MKKISNTLQIKAKINNIAFIYGIIILIIVLFIIKVYKNDIFISIVFIIILICSIIYFIMKIIHNNTDYHNKMKTLQEIEGIIV